MTKVEWFRFSAKATRWKEEVVILEEEIKRVQRFMFYRYEEWKCISDCCSSGLVNRGMAAYAARLFFGLILLVKKFNIN